MRAEPRDIALEHFHRAGVKWVVHDTGLLVASAPGVSRFVFKSGIQYGTTCHHRLAGSSRVDALGRRSSIELRR